MNALQSLLTRIESGGTTMEDCRREELPDRLMWRLRCLIQDRRELHDCVMTFMTRLETPWVARVVVVYALAQPRDEATAELMLRFAQECGEPRIADAVCAAHYNVIGRGGIGPLYENLLGSLPIDYDLPPQFALGQSMGLHFFPPAEEAEVLSKPRHVHPGLVQAIVDRMRQPDGLFIRRRIDFAWDLAMGPGLQRAADRAAVREIAEQMVVSVRSEQYWWKGMEVLLHHQASRDERAYTLVSEMLSNLAVARRPNVMDAVAQRPDELFSPRFVQYVAEAVDTIGADTDRRGSYSGLFAALMVAPDPRWTQWVSVDHPSSRVRELAVDRLLGAATQSSLPVAIERIRTFGWRVLQDSNDRIRRKAARALLTLTVRQPPVISSDEARDSRTRLRVWLQSELQRPGAAADPELTALRQALLND